MTRALITGAAGQDGVYLAEQLLARGYEVHGVTRPGRGGASSSLDPRVTVHEADLASPGVGRLIAELRPDEVYNLAAISSVISRNISIMPVAFTRMALQDGCANRASPRRPPKQPPTQE